MDQQVLKSNLPDNISARLQALSFNDGAATLVLDAGGLDAAARAALELAVHAALEGLEGVREVRVALMGEKPRRRIVAIGSGKGGVGKSTLTANLAVALARMGFRVGVVDADIYGPSQPKLLASEGIRAGAAEKQLLPVDGPEGVKVLSMGHLVDPGKAIAWRGPMAAGALGQLMEAGWGDTELLLVDLPPGTGDVQLTMIQRHRPDGAVIVSTPQDLALIDAKRAIQLFDQVGVPVIGLVENMAGYICPHCGKGSDPFGSGGAESAAAELGVPFLGRIPLAMEIREASDAGTPPAASAAPEGASFHAIAGGLAGWLRG
ncbi:Mrp/NBP35 family ATP-binding protein [Tsuneonella sp. CC-YZS046]|uniref:Mrp/NBP35 family ATP-binding protein n=1 Tax=Tsuneonella sp. CC-YZS046 TaxID=3042152 RepID=UPI002D780B62|nr:Mrp/NBP35 family ATP-binding protein [Tsuneonella sp. CC-YZS046]WRO65527.1 Mrp/NBP35 family ATP-binding protein [Tsuneonella sp. CC-YZS046]